MYMSLHVVTVYTRICMCIHVHLYAGVGEQMNSAFHVCMYMYVYVGSFKHTKILLYIFSK